MYLFYYTGRDGEDEQRPGYVAPAEIWASCARQALVWTVVHAVFAVVIIASDQIPVVIDLTLTGG